MITSRFKQKIVFAILEARSNYSGTDKNFAKSLDINNAAFSRLKNGEIEQILSEGTWLTLARKFQVTKRDETWKTARTSVYTNMEQNFIFCHKYSKSMILIDDCGLGKTHSAKMIIKSMTNSFYVDCSQGKTRQQFIRMIARTVGIDSVGRYYDVKNNLKYYLSSVLDKAFIVLDDAGYLDYPAFLELQELYNATEGNTGWYMIGDDSLQRKIEKGINSKKIGFKAIFSRFQEDYIHISPIESESRKQFKNDLIRQVSEVNLSDQTLIPKIIKKAQAKDASLRYVRTLIEIKEHEQSPNS